MVQLHETSGDQWSDLAENYKKITTETSSRPINVMLERSNAYLPFTKATGILDNGCGPGPVMSRLLHDYNLPESCPLTCSDFSDGMIKHVQNTKEDAINTNANSPWSRVETVVQDATNLQSIEDSSKSHVTAGWVYFMTPDPQKCLRESRRVLKDGGVLACSSWQGSQWMDLMKLVSRVRPEAKLPEMPKEWENVDLLKNELDKAGFKDVESHKVDVQMSFEKMEPLLAFITKMPHMVMLTKNFSEDEMARLQALFLEEGKKMCPDEPGSFKGTSLVTVGRK